jgi:hypothetical protein
VLLDNRPIIRSAPVIIRYAKLSFEPSLWIIVTYGFLCSLQYSVNVARVGSLVLLYRLLFGFRPLEVVAFAPSGLTNYPLAIILSIFGAISPELSVQSALFWVGIPLLSGSRPIVSRRLGGLPKITSGLMHGSLRRALRLTKGLVFLFLALYLSLYSSALIQEQYTIISQSRQNDMSENMHFTACVSWVVTRANGTIERSPPCNPSVSSTPHHVNRVTNSTYGFGVSAI